MAVQMEDKIQILEEVHSLLRETEYRDEAFECRWLPGDASNRFYGRLQFQFTNHSLILMVINAPEAFKSEEVTGASESKITELPFVTIARGFQKEGIRTPNIVAVDEDSRFLICEDFGDELLYLRRQKESALSWYEYALEELSRIQKTRPFEPIKGRRFTPELLSWEFDHFLEYALLKRNKKISDSDVHLLKRFFNESVSKLTKSEFTVVHRDYHSKNLMILEPEYRVGVIDFQDALMGPPTYDLVSLLRDSYVRLSKEEEERLLKHFEGVSNTKVDRDAYGLMSLQRNLKAAGRFYYISMVKGKDTHLPFVKPTLLRAFQTLKELGELQVLSLLEGLLQNEIA